MMLGSEKEIALLCCLTALATGCGPADIAPEPAPARVEVPRPGLADGVFPMVELAIAEKQIPERFWRELPGSVAAFREKWPDYASAHVRRGLCAGSPAIVDRFKRAVGAAVASGDVPDELRATYGELLADCERPELCSWATRAVKAGSGAASVAWVALARCPGDAVQALFERAGGRGGAPADLLIEYWTGRSWSEGYQPRWNPPLVKALGEVARAGDVWNARAAAVLVSEVGEAAAEPLLALYDELPAGEVRDQIASSFRDLEHPRARELFAEYCRQHGDTDAVCQSDWSPLERLSAPGPEVGLGIAAESPSCLERDGLEAVLAAGDDEAALETSECLIALAGTDRPAAVAQARTVLSWNVDSPSGTQLGSLVQWLDAFPEAGQLEQALRHVGLLDRGPLPGAQRWQSGSGLHPGAVLAASGPVHCFDLRTGRFPNHHDRLLYDLVELAGPPIASALFEEDAPAFEHPDGGWVVAGRRVDAPPPGITEGMPYRLRAYFRGRVYGAEVQDYGDWYDLDRVLGLFNAMAADQEVDARVVTLPAGDQTACVLAAPREAILAGIEAGLLQVGAGGAAERGRELERQTLRQMLRQGHP